MQRGLLYQLYHLADVASARLAEGNLSREDNPRFKALEQYCADTSHSLAYISLVRACHIHRRIHTDIGISMSSFVSECNKTVHEGRPSFLNGQASRR